MNFKELFLTLFFSGKSRYAPGTVGSLVALILAIPILIFLGKNTLFLLSILISLISIKIIDEHEKNSGTHDNPEIVIDELVGMWIALSFVPFNYIYIIMAFLAFRFFDIKKPCMIGVVDEKVKGGLGVIADDFLAGIMAGLSVALVAFMYESLMGYLF